MLDSVLAIETPEGVTLSLRLAGLIPRVAAYIIDQLIRFALLFACFMVLSSLREAGIGMALLIGFLLEWWYPVIFEVYGNGATPGKRVQGICVMQVDGLPVSFQSSLVRNLLRFADLLPIGHSLGILSMAKTRNYQRLGDMVAGTVVVWRETARLPTDILEAAAVEPPVKLTPDEQRTLITFVERLKKLNPERQIELSDLMQPLTHAIGAEGLHKLVGMANFLEGNR